jgi:hypothetical protein
MWGCSAGYHGPDFWDSAEVDDEGHADVTMMAPPEDVQRNQMKLCLSQTKVRRYELHSSG